MLMTAALGMNTRAHYVCARCWGPLIAFQDREHPGALNVVCAKGPERCDGQGFVTKRYTERRLGESVAELWEVRQNYPSLEKRTKKTGSQLLAELGFS